MKYKRTSLLTTGLAMVMPYAVGCDRPGRTEPGIETSGDYAEMRFVYNSIDPDNLTPSQHEAARQFDELDPSETTDFAGKFPWIGSKALTTGDKAFLMEAYKMCGAAAATVAPP